MLRHRDIKPSIKSTNASFFTSISVILFFLAIFTTICFSLPLNAASAPTYKYYNSGTEIGVTGGEYYGANATKFTALSPGSNKYNGELQINYTFPSGFLWLGRTTVTCKAGIQITVSTSNKSSGSVETPDKLNSGAQSIGDSNSTVVRNCQTDWVSKIAEFNQPSISISGTINDTATITDLNEADDKKQIGVTVFSNQPSSKITTTVEVTLKNLDGTLIESIKPVFDEDNTASVFFKSVKPNSYNICITPPQTFNFSQCQSVTKIAGTVPSIKFGSLQTVYNIDGKVVNAVVNLEVTNSSVGSYGPLTVFIKKVDNSTTISTADTNTIDTSAVEGLSGKKIVQLSAVFNSIEPGQYIACTTISSEDFCSNPFTKAVNIKSDQPETLINIPLDKTAQLLKGATGSSCAIGGIGWIVCPVMTFLGDIADSAFGFLANNFLSTNVSLLNSSSGTYTAWQAMRNIANVAFVIVFLIIIFSQITSFGVDNYGIKKLLPRLIIAAILVNISFFVCQIAVDLSNISGYSLGGLFDNIIKSIPLAATGSKDVVAGVFTFAGIVLVALAAGVALLLAITVPVLLAALVAVLMTALILLARTALIVILVVISPLAFVAYLLPNTEQWFKKWGKTFAGLLLVFPIIAVVFGGGKLAARILNDAAQGEPLLQLIALGVSVIPLFVVPSLLKGSMNAAGSIGTKLAGLSSKANGKIGGKVKDTSMLGAYSAARTRNQQIKRASITGGVYKGKNRFTQAVNWGHARMNSNRVLNRVTGDVGTRTAQQAAQLANKLDIENVTASKAQILQANVTGAELATISDGGSVRGINGKDASTKAAAMESLLERGQFGDFQTSWNNMVDKEGSVKGGSETMRVVASTMARSSSNPTFMSAGDLQNTQEGHARYDTTDSSGKVTTNELQLGDIAQRGVASNRYSTLKLVATSNPELDYITSNADTTGKANLKRAADQAFATPEIEQNIKQNRVKLADLSSDPVKNKK